MYLHTHTHTHTPTGMYFARSRIGWEDPRGGAWDGCVGVGGGDEEEEEEEVKNAEKEEKEEGEVGPPPVDFSFLCVCVGGWVALLLAL